MRLELAILNNGCGWPADCLDAAERPPLAERLAQALAAAQRVLDAATPDERERLVDWLGSFR